MISIDEASYFIPEHYISLSDMVGYYGLTQSQINVFRRIYGLEKIPIAEKTSMIDLIQNALSKIISSFQFDKSDVKLIIHAHTTKNVSPFGSSLVQEIKKINRFDHAQAFGLSINNCASTLSAIEIADHWLESFDKNAKAIILTGERTFTFIQKVIPNVTILGDASAVMILGKNKRNRLLSLEIAVNGKHSAGIWATPDQSKQFERDYTSTFSKVISNAIRKADLTLSDITILLPHNVNLPSWRNIAKFLNYPIQKIFINNIDRYAHCFGSDILINYVDAVRDNKIKKGDYFVMATVGLGTMYAAAVFQH